MVSRSDFIKILEALILQAMKEFETNEEFIYSLIIDDLDNSISPDHKHLLEQWRSSSPANESTYKEFVSVQRNIDQLYEQQYYTAQESWAVLDKKISAADDSRSVSRKGGTSIWFSIAASVLLVFSIGYYFFSDSRYTVVKNEMNAAVKSIYLPDGTQINLNGGTTLRYIASQFNTKRNVELLNGEVFIHVVHKSRYPFIVDMGEVQAQDIGTSFNIIKSKQDVTLTVEEGKVAFKQVKTEKSILLDGGNTGIYHSGTGELVAKKNGDVNYKSWMNKDFVFTETPLQDVTSQLSKVYNTPITISGNELKTRKLTAHLHYQTLDSALNVIAATLQCSISNTKKGYTLSAN